MATGLEGQFQLPMVYDLTATFMFALTGGMLALKRGYDVVGLMILCVISGAGGGLIRDGIFLQNGPPVLVQNWQYLGVIGLAVIVVLLLKNVVSHLLLAFLIADALGLSLFAIVGAQMSIDMGLGLFAAVLIGLMNAIGGGMLRDVITRHEPIAMLPGQFYGMSALTGLAVFLILGVGFKVDAQSAALIGIAIGFALRMLAVHYDWKTLSVGELSDMSPINPLTKMVQRTVHRFKS